MSDDLVPMQSEEQARIEEIRKLRRQHMKDKAVRKHLAPDPNIKGDEGYTMPLSMRIMHFLRRRRLRRMLKRFEKDYGYTP